MWRRSAPGGQVGADGWAPIRWTAALGRLRRILQWFGLYRDPSEAEARGVVRDAFAASYPEDVIEEIRLRAAERDTCVFAVVTRPVQLYRGMPPYRLFAVERDLLLVQEISKDPDSPYILRGIK